MIVFLNPLPHAGHHIQEQQKVNPIIQYMYMYGAIILLS